jgi:ribosome biogenesis GTPase A
VNISWFPGHMKKAERFVREFLPLVDSVLIVLDARIPESSRNRELERLIGEKPFMFVLNKIDCAEKQATLRWLDFFSREGFQACAVSSKTGRGFDTLRKALEAARRKVVERRQAKKRREELIRLMIMGVPNVGKSSIINRLGKRSSAKVGKKPGVTRSYQWVKVSPLIEILDLPGIFYPRLSSQEQGLRCASVGLVKEEVLPLEDVALFIMKRLTLRECPQAGEKSPAATFEKLEQTGRRYGFLLPNGAIDIQRTALFVIKNFREGGSGGYTLELPPSRAGVTPLPAPEGSHE